MSNHIRRGRGGVATGCIAVFTFLLAGCGETPVTPSPSTGASGGPQAALSSTFDQFQFLGFVLDDNGANDTPAQSDLNAFTRADNVTGQIAVKWAWDDVNSWTGSGQTGDACALFDTDNDGKANSAVCVRINNPGGDPTQIAQLPSPGSPLNYSCGDNKADRCASPARSAAIGAIVCEVEKIGEDFFSTGDDSADVLAACRIPFTAIGAATSPNLLNVCSFPSGSPNSNPFDCVVTPGAGFIVIKKATTPQTSADTFSFAISPTPAGGANHSIIDSTSSVEVTGLISAAPGTSYSVSEDTLSSGWVLDSASCVLDRTPPVSTGSRTGRTISSITVASGETTVCTFYNEVQEASISVTKDADVDTILAVAGDSVAGFHPDVTYLRGSGGGGGGSTPVFASDVCDDGGANDQPAQVDMNCFSRADNVSGRLNLRWTWDDINAWTGTGQTGDACSLLDTDANGKANFAFCARVTNPGGDPTVVAQAPGSPILYACKDTPANPGEVDRCASKVLVKALDASSVCSVDTVAEHFTALGDDGADTQALCNLKLSDLGPGATSSTVNLLNVCSFPSGSPNSNPFDCVVTPAAGFLVITKATTPTNANAIFGFRLRDSANTANATATNGNDEFGVQGGATSAAIPILPGTYALTELLPSGWVQDSIACTRDGVPVGTDSGATRLGVTIAQGATTTCAFTNTLVATDTVTFTVVVTNEGTSSVTLDSLADSENPLATTPTYTTLSGVGTCNSTTNAFGTIAGGGTYTCTFTRVVSGSPGFVHRDKVRAVASNGAASDTKLSSVVTVIIQ